MRTKLAVNGEFSLLCWSIGRDILDRQHNRPKAGEEVIERLAKNLGVAFLGSKASIRATSGNFGWSPFDQDVVGVRRWRVRCGLPTIRSEPKGSGGMFR